MKTILLSFVLLISMSTLTHAQISKRFGVVGGLHSASIRSTGLDSKFGFHIGGVAELAINDNVLIRPQLLYSTKGASVSAGGLTYSINLSYIEIPIHAVYKAEVGTGKLFGGLGPYIGILAGARDSDGDDVDGLKTVDAGLSLLGGYELTEQKISVNLFYNTGFTNIATNAPRTGSSNTNSTFGLSVAYFFGE